MIKFTRGKLGMTLSRTFAATALLAVIMPAAGQAAVVESISGGMFLKATAYAVDGGDPPSAVTDFDAASFYGTPTSLSVNASAQETSASGRASASISLAADSSWASLDHGTFNFSALLSLYHDGYQNTSYAAYEQYDGAFWHYHFVTNADATFKFIGHNTLRGGEYSNYLFELFNGNDIKCFVSLGDLSDSCSINLIAGTEYDFNVRPAGPLQSRTVTGQTKVDDSLFFLTEFAFDIIAVSAPPTDGGGAGAVPEPANWALMIAGLGLVGATLRGFGRQRRAVRFV